MGLIPLTIPFIIGGEEHEEEIEEAGVSFTDRLIVAMAPWNQEGVSRPQTVRGGGSFAPEEHLSFTQRLIANMGPWDD